MNEADPSVVNNFSLVIGGPFYRFLARLHLAEPEPNLYVRTVVLILLTWLPLLALSQAQGTLFGNRVYLPLLHDFAVWSRLLGSLPLFVIAEIVIDPWIRRVVRTFSSSGIVRDADTQAFHSAIVRIERLRDSGVAELILAIVAFVPLFLAFDYEWVSSASSAWHGSISAGLSPAGWWFASVSSPIFRFILFRWLWRYTLWCALLYKIMRLKLNLRPGHPDRLGGLGFVSSAQQHFGILFTALGLSVAGQYMTAITYFHMNLKDTRIPMLAFVLSALLVILGPLVVLSPRLALARRSGLARYSQAARRLTESFESKWIDGTAVHESMMGNPDPSSMIDFNSTFDIVDGMKIIPVSKRIAISVAAQAAGPMALVWLFTTPVEQLIRDVLKMVL